MAGHLVRLKLALMRAGLAAVGVRGKVAFGIAYVFAVAFGLLAAALFAALRWDSTGTSGSGSGSFDDVATVLLGVVFLAWVFGPVMTVASENTLEVDRLALFPLTQRELMTGLLLASMVGFGGLTTVITLVGGVVGLAPASAGAVVTVFGIALLFATCVAASRLVSTALSAATRTRRWRDLALTIVPLSFFIMNLAFNGMRLGSAGSGSGGSDGPSGGAALALRVLRLLPSAPATSAVLSARHGDWGAAVGWLVVGVGVLVGLVWLWSLAVRRVLTSALESGGPSAKSGAASRRGRSSFYPAALRWLPRNRVGAVAVKELRLQWRDPRRRTGLISAAVFAGLPLVTMRSQAGLGHGVVLVAVLPAVLFGISAINQYGFDGPSFWMHVAAGDDGRSDLLGKNIEIAIVTVCVVGFEAVVLAALSGGWGLVVPAFVLSALALGVLLGVGNVTSVWMPVPMPDSTTNTWASNTSQGIQTMGPVLGGMVLSALVVGPFAAMSLAWADEPARLALVMAAEGVIGLAVWRVGLELAVRRGLTAQAELLDKLTRRAAV